MHAMTVITLSSSENSAVSFHIKKCDKSNTIHTSKNSFILFLPTEMEALLKEIRGLGFKPHFPSPRIDWKHILPPCPAVALVQRLTEDKWECWFLS